MGFGRRGEKEFPSVRVVVSSRVAAGVRIADAGALPPHPRSLLLLFRQHPCWRLPSGRHRTISWSVLLWTCSPVARVFNPCRDALHGLENPCYEIGDDPVHPVRKAISTSEAPSSLWSGVFRRGAAGRMPAEFRSGGSLRGCGGEAPASAICETRWSPGMQPVDDQ